MIIPENIFLRMYLIVNGTFRKFYWFEMKNDELYWGTSAKKNSFSSQHIKNESNITIEIPENFSNYPKVNIKNSYHKSGQVHIKEQKEEEIIYHQVATLKSKEDIQKPYRIYSLITPHLKYYNDVVDRPKSNEKKNEYASCIEFDESIDILEKRMFMEFFLSPVGTFDIPSPLFSTHGRLPYIMTHSMSPRLVLITAFGPFDQLNDWHPELSIGFVGNIEENL